MHIIETANITFKKASGLWEKNSELISAAVYDRSRNGIINDGYSRNDLNFIQRALTKCYTNCWQVFLPLQLFISNANVTRLNKCSTYSIVLYILCFLPSRASKACRECLIFPVVGNHSISGRIFSVATDISSSAMCLDRSFLSTSFHDDTKELGH